MMHFNLCAYKDCRNKAFAVAKDGEGFCEKHAILICEQYGMNEFWPHYHHPILMEMKRKEEAEQRKVDREKRKRAPTPALEVLIMDEMSKRKVTKID